MRRAKDNRQVVRRYYRPEQMTCPGCGQDLKRAYPLWRKYIVFLNGRYLVTSVGYHCLNPACVAAPAERMHASQAAACLTVRGSSFALEVIVQIGYWRFWKRWTVTQIHEALTQAQQLPISEREVLYLIGVFLVLLRCTYHLRLAEHAADFQRHGLFLAMDALKPEKGNRVLYVVRELKFGLVLHHVSLFSADQSTLEKHLLQPLKDLPYRLRGVVSDDEKALRLAIAHALAGVSHQTCQLHCLRDAATPIVQADQSLKKTLKKAIRAPLYTVYRALNQLAPDDPRQAVLSSYADLIRTTLTEGSKPPFALGGLQVFEDLTRLDLSLERSRKKRGIRCWINCWLWCNAVCLSALAIGNSNVNAVGWWNWTDGLTRRKPQANHPPRAALSNVASKNSWRSWNSTPDAIRQRRRWSLISAVSFGNAGRDCSLVMLGPSVTAPTTPWKLSSDDCAPANDKFMVANPCMSSSSAMGNGRFILTPASRWHRC